MFITHLCLIMFFAYAHVYYSPMFIVLSAELGRSTLNVLNYKYKYFPPQKYFKYKYIPFWGNVLKYIPSTFKMYLSTNTTISSTFQLPSNFLYPDNQTKFLTYK